MNNVPPPPRLDELIDRTVVQPRMSACGLSKHETEAVNDFLRSHKRLLSLIDVEALEAGEILLCEAGAKHIYKDGRTYTRFGCQLLADNLRALAEAAKGMGK
jgi:hypothetical protein